MNVVIIGGLIMIDIKMKKLEGQIDAAIKSIRSDESVKLFSITKRINKKTPLQVFEGAKRFGKDRFYWMNAERTLTITGVGATITIEAEKDRYHQTETVWKQILNEAWIENEYSSIPATGVVAFGGMEFDPLKPKTELWKKFKTSQFYIPEMMVTEFMSDYFFTINIFIHKEDCPADIADKIYEQEKAFFFSESFTPEHIEIIQKEEIEPIKWKQTVDDATEVMKKKKVEKIVLARELRLRFNQEVNIPQVLKKLNDTQSNSYIFAFESGGDCFIGATPERLVKLEKNNLLSTCLAGTAPRGKTEEEDKQIGYELLHDKKNREEHEFVVKMIKDALLKTCTDVEMPKEPVLHPLKNLQHLYTPVTGVLSKGFSIFDVVKNLHPTPALGGTPTEESLAFIREHELLDRGWYGAPIGWVDSNDNGEFAVAIRSGLIQGDSASLFAGCGVLADSDPEMEFEETRIKMLPMLNVLGG